MKEIEAMEKTGKLAEDRSNITPIKQPWFCVAALPLGGTIVVTGLVYWWVRKRGWIPKRMD